MFTRHDYPKWSNPEVRFTRGDGPDVPSIDIEYGKRGGIRIAWFFDRRVQICFVVELAGRDIPPEIRFYPNGVLHTMRLGVDLFRELRSAFRSVVHDKTPIEPVLDRLTEIDPRFGPIIAECLS